MVRVIEHELLDLVDQTLALGRIEGPGLARVEVVDPRVAEPPPVVRVSRGVALEEEIGVVVVAEEAVDDDLEVLLVTPVREPGRGLERAVLGLDPDTVDNP